MGTLGPLVKEVETRRAWVVSAAALTLAGLVSSATMGAIVGGLGKVLVPDSAGGWGLAIVITLALVAAAREFGWISVPLPQPKRQTSEWWGKLYGRRAASLLWGLDLGLTFTTWFTFSGPLVLAALAFVVGNLFVGTALFTMMWLGRALSVWLAPLLMRGATTAPQMLDSVSRQKHILQLEHGVALVVVAALLVVAVTV